VSPPEVTLFPTCLAETVRPGLVERVRRVLTARGATVRQARGATCCGQPALNAGFTADARRVARRTLRALARTDGPIVVPSGSCAAMMSHHWPGLFAGTADAARAVAVADRVVELSQWSAPVTAEGVAAGTAGAGAAQTVGFVDSCHGLRVLGVGPEARAALRAAGHEVVDAGAQDRCCGFGGTFSVAQPEVSVAMADERLDAYVAAGVTTVTGCDLSCLVHLEGRARHRGLRLRFVHLAELLDDGGPR
jgi:L-lactate dehydrogenase complex protein LldE